MSNFNNDKERKGGFWSALSGLFGGGGAPGAGAAGGLFATKAGIVGMVLGGATIAAGVGVVYNFVGSSSKPVYSPELFQNSYYEEEAASASQQRAQSRDRSAAAASTLDLFSEQARKEGISGGMGSEAGEQKSAEAPADGAQAAASAEAPAADPGAAAPGAAGPAGGAKLAPAASLGGGGRLSGGGSSIPRMQNQGGLAGGIGGQFANMYRPPAGANDGRVNGMSSARYSAKSSPKYAVPNFKKSGAYGQAKATNARSRAAAYTADATGSRSTAEAAFSGETGAGGDVGGEAGAGLGGAGISQGSGLKGNDPNLNSSEFNVPPVNNAPPPDVSPWNDLLMAAMWTGIGCLAMILTTNILSSAAKKGGPYASVLYGFAVATAYIAIAAALAIVGIGIALMIGKKSEPPDPEKDFEGQTMMGAGIVYVGLLLAKKAIEALSGCEKPSGEQTKGIKAEDGTFKDGYGNARSGAPDGAAYEHNYETTAKGPDGKDVVTKHTDYYTDGGYKLDADGSLPTSGTGWSNWSSPVTSALNSLFKGL